MPEFNLIEDQVGKLADDGNIVSHPKLDILGNRYDKGNATRKYLAQGGKRFFVVLPLNTDSDENTFKLPPSLFKPAPKE